MSSLETVDGSDAIGEDWHKGIGGLLILTIPVSIGLRLWWSSEASFERALIFWSWMVIRDPLWFIVWWRDNCKFIACATAFASIGGMMNAAVTLANDGRMPVAPFDGMPDMRVDGIHVMAAEHHRLLALSDHLNGFSPGDAIMFCAGLVGIAGYFLVDRHQS